MIPTGSDEFCRFVVVGHWYVDGVSRLDNDYKRIIG